MRWGFRYIGTVVALLIVAAAAAYGNWKAWDESQKNKDLSCAMARLISYVPAVQFEGEPLDNFLGWLRSRREMLTELREHENCDAETQMLLERRVRLDNELLEELERP